MEKKESVRFRKLPGWMCLCLPITTVESVDRPYIFVLWVTTTQFGGYLQLFQKILYFCPQKLCKK